MLPNHTENGNTFFRFHSWMPFYADIETIKSDPASIRPGVDNNDTKHLKHSYLHNRL